MRTDPYEIAIEERIGAARARVLGGFGPGATPTQLDRAQRDRPTLGAQPAATERRRVAEQALLARGDPDALVHLVAGHTGALASTTRALGSRWRARRAEAAVRMRVLATTAALGALVGAAASVVARAVLRHCRSVPEDRDPLPEGRRDDH